MRKRKFLPALLLAAGILSLPMIAFSAGTLSPRNESLPARTRSPKTLSPGSRPPGRTDGPSKTEPDEQLARLIWQLLKGEKVEVRRTAAETLGKIGDAQAVEPLTQAINDQNRQVRSQAAESLVKIGGEDGIKALADALESEDEHVTGVAARALEASGWRPDTRRQRIRYLIARNMWKEAAEIAQVAEAREKRPNSAEGTIEFDSPILLKLTVEWAGLQGPEWIEFKQTGGLVQAYMHVRGLVSPQDVWRTRVELMTPDARVLTRAEDDFSNTCLDMSFVPLPMSKVLHFRFGQSEDLSEASRFRVTIVRVPTFNLTHYGLLSVRDWGGTVLVPRPERVKPKIRSEATSQDRQVWTISLRIEEPGRAMKWSKVLPNPVSPDAWPVLEMQYRAKGLQQRDAGEQPQDEYLLYIYDERGDNGGFAAAWPSEFVTDGESHGIRVDLAKFEPVGNIRELEFQLLSGGSGKALLAIENLMLWGAPAERARKAEGKESFRPHFVLDGEAFRARPDLPGLAEAHRSKDFSHSVGFWGSAFRVGEPYRTMIWERRLDPPIDPQQYPVLFVQYKADRVSTRCTADNRRILSLMDGREGGFTAIGPDAIVPDGYPHEIRVDLAPYDPKGITGLTFQICSNDEGNGGLQIEKFMFLGEPDWTGQPLTTTSASEGRPVRSEREARSAKSLN